MSISDASSALIQAFPAISLAEIQHEADFQTRRDRKYLLNADRLPDLLASLGEGTRVLEIDGRRSFSYITPYFDDAEHSSYLLAARRRPNRFKVRTRRYVASGLQMLEVKVRDAQGRTVKHRTDVTRSDLVHLGPWEREWISAFPQIGASSRALSHCMTTEYERVTLALPNRAGRVTIDHRLAFQSQSGSRCAVPELLTIETKSAGRGTDVDRLLWRMGERPVALSKFASGLSLLDPALPANRWHRTIQRIREQTDFSHR